MIAYKTIVAVLAVVLVIIGTTGTAVHAKGTDYDNVKSLIDQHRVGDQVKLNANDKLGIPTDAKVGVAYQLQSMEIDASTGATKTVDEGVVRFHMPLTEAHKTKRVFGDDDLAIYAGTSYDIALEASAAGFAAYVVVKDSSAPTLYRFSVTLPDGLKLSENGSGGIEVLNGANEVVGVVGAPWAVDSSGATVRTAYKLHDGALVQTVVHQGAAYPVVADPRTEWRWTHITKVFLLGEEYDDLDEGIDAAELFVPAWANAVCTGAGIGAVLGGGTPPAWAAMILICGNVQSSVPPTMDALEDIEDEYLSDPVVDDCELRLEIALYGAHFRRVELKHCGVTFRRSIRW